MKSIGPRLAFNVPSQVVEAYEDAKEKDERKKTKFRSKDDGTASPSKIELEFNNIKDFDPINIVKQVKRLRDLFEKRSLLSDLLTKLEGNDELEKQLRDILGKDETALKALSALANSPASGASTAAAGDDPAVAATAAAELTAKAAADVAAKTAADVTAKETAAANAKAAAGAAAKTAADTEAKAAAARAAKVAAETTAKAADAAKVQAAADAPAKAAADKAREGGN
jgi:hypothetical protein